MPILEKPFSRKTRRIQLIDVKGGMIQPMRDAGEIIAAVADLGFCAEDARQSGWVFQSQTLPN